MPHSPTLPPPVTTKQRVVKFQISHEQGTDGCGKTLRKGDFKIMRKKLDQTVT